MENKTTLNCVVEESQRRRSDLIADRLHELNGGMNPIYNLPFVSSTLLLPKELTILCTDEAGLLVKISYDESSKDICELCRYKSPIEMRNDVDMIMDRYNANKGSSIAVQYIIPKDVSGYHSLPEPMIRFLNGANKKYDS